MKKADDFAARNLQSRLASLGATLTKTDRILSGNRDLKVLFQACGQHYPAKTDGKIITINTDTLGNIRSSSTLVTILGLNYHELAHVLYSVRTGPMVSEIISGGMTTAYNALEDQRIESLFSAQYDRAKKYFTAPVLRFLAEKEATWPMAHLLTHGRKFLPRELRAEFRNLFEGRPDQRRRGEVIIDRYRELENLEQYSRGANNEALVLIRAFHLLLKELTPPGQTPPLGNHSCAGSENMEEGRPIRATSESQRVQDENDEEEVTDNDAGITGENDPDEETETDDKHNGGSVDSGDPENGDGDSGDDGSSDASPEDESGDEEDDDGEEGGDPFAGSPGEDSEDDGDAGSSEVPSPGGGDPDDPDSGSSSGGDSDASEENDEDQKGGNSGEVSEGGTGVGALTEEEKETIRQWLEDAGEEIQAEGDVQDDTTRLIEAMDVPNVDLESMLEEKSTGARIPTADESIALSRVMDEFRRMSEQVEPGWERGSETGRINFSRVASGDDEDLFDAWQEGEEQETSVEIVALLDLSASMGTMSSDNRIRRAESALWILKRACDDNPEIDMSVVGYGTSTRRIYARGQYANPNAIDQFSADDGGTQPAEAMIAARAVLEETDHENKLFVIITDGEWTGGDRKAGGGYYNLLELIEEIPGTRMYLGIGQRCAHQYEKGFDVHAVVYNPMDMVPAIQRVVQSVREESLKRR